MLNVFAHYEIVTAIAVMGFASYFCRFAGYFLMGFVTITPKVEVWLLALPIALIGAILGPIAVNGGLAEWIGFVVAIGAMWLTRNDLISSIGAVAAVALVRLYNV
jgi:branched chain amino acid efflux pump